MNGTSTPRLAPACNRQATIQKLNINATMQPIVGTGWLKPPVRGNSPIAIICAATEATTIAIDRRITVFNQFFLGPILEHGPLTIVSAIGVRKQDHFEDHSCPNSTRQSECVATRT